MIELKGDYLREEFLKFISNDFLNDFNRDIRKVNTTGLTSIQTANYLGESKSLDLQVFEFFYDGSSNKRVALTKDAFSVMRSSAIFRALAVFKSTDSNDWRFSLLTATPEATEKGRVAVSYSNPKRLSFFLGPNAKVNTPIKFLISKGKVIDFDDLKNRFSIEVVNKEFYKEISVSFTKLVDGLLKLPDSVDKSQTNLEFAVRLIGRIIFCWFLKEKKNKNGIALIPLELLSLEAISKYEDYYHNILEPIFFEILNKPIKERIDKFTEEPYSTIPYLNGGLFSPEKDDFYKRGIYQSDFYNNLVIPDEWLKEFFTILETYNFTIDENTSYDEELSIDPEMLGRIFENLLAEINPETGESARKSTGSYYTPRIIVDYMVDESLLLYLKQQTEIKEEKLKAVISYELTDDADNPTTLEEREKIVNALEKVKILDPACGSGAFPIGALQKIVFILQQVDPDGSLWFKKQLTKASPEFRRDIEKKFSNKEFDFLRKLGVIRECIYGVDIQPIATEISRLRCFLTLIVDEHIDDREENRGIKPLPNLDFKFVTANSLIGLPKLDDPNATVQQPMIFDDRENIDELKNIRDQYFTSSGIEREKLKLDFSEQQKVLIKQMYREHGYIGMAKSELTQKLTDWEPFTHKRTDWFDSEWMFGIKEGFDIVIANPPYVEFKNLSKEIKYFLEKIYLTTTGKYDLYIPFYEKAIDLLKNNGALTFISPTRFLHRDYGQKLRMLLLNKTLIHKILDFVDHQVFNTALTYTGVFIFQKHEKCIDNNFKYIKLKMDIFNETLAKIYDNEVFEEISINQNTLSSKPWYISNSTIEALLQKIDKVSVPLESVCEGIYQGVATGKDKVFIVNKSEAQKYKIERELLVPFIKGKNISKYKISWNNLFLIYPYDKQGYPIPENNLSINYPNGYKYLLKNKNELKGRKYFEKSNKFWYELWNQRNLNRFYREKLITLDNSKINSFAYDNSNYIGSTTTYSILLKDTALSYKYLLGVLNSKLLNFYHKKRTIPQAGGYYRYQATFIKGLPILVKIHNLKKENLIVNCVNEILSLTTSDNYKTNSIKHDQVIKYEKEVDHMVYELYGLTQDEIKIVERENG
jgi:hypothetical protein